MASKHPSWNEILAVVESDAAAREEHRAHIQECGSCSRTADEARRLVAALEAGQLSEVPAALRERTLVRMRDELAALARNRDSGVRPVLEKLIERAGERLSELWADLVADSLQASHAVRGVSHATPRMLLYETDEFSISISISPGDDPGTVDIAGQVTPRSDATDFSGAEAGLRAGESELSSSISEFGEFGFPSVPEGEVALEFGIGETLIRMAPIRDLSDPDTPVE